MTKMLKYKLSSKLLQQITDYKQRQKDQQRRRDAIKEREISKWFAMLFNDIMLQQKQSNTKYKIIIIFILIISGLLWYFKEECTMAVIRRNWLGF